MILTPNQKRAIRHLWKGELTLAEIAEEMEFTPEQLAEAVASLGLPERSEADVYLPTRAEIRKAAAEIRAGWTPAEREARLCGSWRVRLEYATERDTNAGGSATTRGPERSPPHGAAGGRSDE